MHLYIIRHADPCYDPDSLTEVGHREAAALAPRLKEFGVTHVYSSPLVRATQTAAYTADLLGLPIVKRDWLKELDVQIVQDGKSYMVWDTFGEIIRDVHPLATLEDWYRRPPFDRTKIGKYWLSFRESVDEFIAGHGYTREDGRYRIDQSNDDRIALFCHNGTLLMMLAHLLELPPSMVWCGFYSWPSSVTDIYFDERSHHWAVPRALHVADVSHLYKEGLKPQARGMGDRCDEFY
jgi:probable phosphoglycerate mutase